MSGEFEAFLKENGIKHQLTVSFSPYQNGVAERKNRIIMELVCSMLKTKRLPHPIWAEAASSACYVLNRASTKAVQGQTPEEAWIGHKPGVSHFRIFGSLCYSHIPKEKRGKLDDKSESRDVIFGEQAAWDWKNGKESGNIIYDNNLLEEETGTVLEEVPLHASPTSSSSSESASSSSPESTPHKTRSLVEIYGQIKRILEEEYADFALFMENDLVTFEKATKEEKWREAMKQEMDAIQRNKT
ncbi:uncharacterized protein LOC141696316 [Apium graveolens]|uniref:uncharacterized protein LOC141696316 n=1 Tax=Apium graveolens TaxID=4045 RepID=UPI003D7ABDB5